MSAMMPNFLMNGIAGWRTAATTNVAFTSDGACLSLQPLPGSIRPLVDAAGSFGGLRSAIGVAVDGEDRVYILDGHACEVKRFDRCTERFETLSCIGGFGNEPRHLKNPHGLAISRRNDLHLADTGNYRVQIFSLHDLALRAVWEPIVVTPSASGFSIAPAVPSVTPPAKGCEASLVYPARTWQPWDIAITTESQSRVSDYANGLIHFFDSSGCWLAASDGSCPGQPPLSKPTRIAVDRAGRIYVIQENQNYVVVLNADGSFRGTVQQPEQIRGRFQPAAVAVDVNGNLCLSDCLTRKVYFYQPLGDGNWCGWRCCGSAQAFAASMVFDRSGAPLLADGATNVCQLALPSTYPKSGTYLAGPFDSRTYQCVWHRVVLFGSVPQGASVTVDTFTSESAKSADEILSLPESRWATGQIDTDLSIAEWDCLILSRPGRYLWLRLTLTGDGAETPSLRKIRVYYPRSSSLKYLPAVYSQDSVSADFLDRFLSIFDTLRGGISDRITGIARYFDPTATPANPRNVVGTDFLSWLGSWVGMTLESNWPVEKRREMVRNAHQLYALRGTPAGLRLAIQIYAGVSPAILEKFRLRRWLIVNQSTLGNCSSVFGDDVMRRLHIGSNSQIGSFRLVDYGDPALDIFNEYANRFLVIVPRWPGAGDTEMQTLQQIVELAKPAHTVAELSWAEPRLRIGVQSFVGVDTVVGKYPVGVIEGQGTLGFDTVLGLPAEQQSGKNNRPVMRVGRDATVGSNTVLN